MLLTANRELNGKEEPITIRVKAGFEEGSFGIPIEVIQNVSAVDVLQAIGLVSAGAHFVRGSALEVIHRLRARKIDLVETNDQGHISVQVGGESIPCSRTAKKLVVNRTFRDAVNQVFAKPVANNGIDEVGLRFFTDEQQEIALIKEDASSMASPEDIYERIVESEDVEARVKFLSAHADKARNWRVTYNGKAINVEITDDAFLERLRHEDENFNFGRRFTVTMRITTSQRQGYKRTSKTYEIVRVHYEARD